MPKSTTAWDRLREYVSEGLRNADQGFNCAAGIHLGLVIAMDHPEYAKALHQAIETEGMRPSHQSSEQVADDLVAAVPIERIG